MLSLDKLLAFSTVALIGFAAATLPAAGATVSINNLLTNPSFESGQTGWSFNGSSGVYQPGSTQYTAGSDGLSSGFAPGGTHAAQVPIPGGSSGDIIQDLSVTYLASTDYTFTFWLGTPKGDTTLGTDRIYFLEGTTTTNRTADGLQAFDVVAPAAGQWAKYTVTETALLAQLGAISALNGLQPAAATAKRSILILL
jgi:hypothetical protein